VLGERRIWTGIFHGAAWSERGDRSRRCRSDISRGSEKIGKEKGVPEGSVQDFPVGRSSSFLKSWIIVISDLMVARLL